MYRARVKALWSDLNGWCWWFDIYDTTTNTPVVSACFWDNWEDAYRLARIRLWKYNARAEKR